MCACLVVWVCVHTNDHIAEERQKKKLSEKWKLFIQLQAADTISPH